MPRATHVIALVLSSNLLFYFEAVSYVHRYAEPKKGKTVRESKDLATKEGTDT